MRNIRARGWFLPPMDKAPHAPVRSHRSLPGTEAPAAATDKDLVERTSGHSHALPDLSREGSAALPTAADVRTRQILGLPIAMTDYEQAMDVMDGMVARRERGYVCAVAVHAVMVAQGDAEMKRALLGSTLTVPDGMPLVWAANALGENLPQRVYGPELMRRYSQRCATQDHRVWLYGGRDQGHLVQLALRLRQRHPGIKIVGGYAPPFRPLTGEEEDAVAAQINEAKPDVLWVGIGVPKQEKWMHHIRERLD